MTQNRTGLERRRFLAALGAAGAGLGFWGGEASALPQEAIELDDVASALSIAGLDFEESEERAMRGGLGRYRSNYRQVRELGLENGEPPSLQFKAEGWHSSRVSLRLRRPKGQVVENFAFASIADLGRALDERRTSAVELCKYFLARLKTHDATLHCVINVCEERALAQAKDSDERRKRGASLGPLDGIPWGVKDLFSTKGIPTTWGAKPFENQIIDEDAAVVESLDAAGAVLVAKLTTGALAMGDVWFGGRTRNPWNPERGSSGSSAGPASAVSGGLVPFAIGTETLGSIVSPSTRCGVTGLRPTFGRVSRRGCMALSWSMDKIGPIARSAEDCALVFAAIQGQDAGDPASVGGAFDAAADFEPADLKIAYLEDDFTRRRRGRGEAMNGLADLEQSGLDACRSIGAKLESFRWPDFPSRSLMTMLDAEAAAAFDEITRDGRVRELVSQGRSAWPALFRRARLIPAVEYIQAARARRRLMQETEKALGDYDVVIAPTHAGQTLSLTNLTGHPCLVMPLGFLRPNQPVAISFIGRLHGEETLIALARRWQEQTRHHLTHPEL